MFKIRNVYFKQINNLSTKKYNTYIQNSPILTNHFQNNLNQLPLPKLETTLENLLKSAIPLIKKEEFNQLKKDVKTFKKSKIIKYHQELQQKAKYSNFMSGKINKI